MSTMTAQRKWMIIVAILGLAIIVLLAVVIHLATHSSDSSSAKEFIEADDEKAVLAKYAQFFVPYETYTHIVKWRTNDGQELTLELCLRNATKLAKAEGSESGNSSLITSTSGGCKKKLTFHGCCDSTLEYLTPEEAQTVTGETVTLIQYPPRYVQMFSAEECKTVAGCTLRCQCYNMMSSATAVIRKTVGGRRSVGTALIEYSGCCKCINYR